jgi:hypothetical protein
MLLEDAVRTAKRLFLQFSNNFELEFDTESKIYKLRTKKCQSLHPLESCLLGHENLTGKKYIDISTQISKPIRWILGFHHGYLKKTKAFSNLHYCEGYIAGINIINKIDSVT